MANPTSYKPGNSLLHKTDPRIKTLVLIFFTVLILSSRVSFQSACFLLPF